MLRTMAPLVVPLVTQSAAHGALASLRAATDPTARGGQYVGPSVPGELMGSPKLVGSSGQSTDVTLQQRLWAVSEKLTGVVYPF